MGKWGRGGLWVVWSIGGGRGSWDGGGRGRWDWGGRGRWADVVDIGLGDWYKLWLSGVVLWVTIVCGTKTLLFCFNEAIVIM